jgi:hypothetical protein
MPAPEKPPNLVIYMPQLHLSDSLLAEAILEFFKSRRDWEGESGKHWRLITVSESLILADCVI